MNNTINNQNITNSNANNINNNPNNINNVNPTNLNTNAQVSNQSIQSNINNNSINNKNIQSNTNNILGKNPNSSNEQISSPFTKPKKEKKKSHSFIIFLLFIIILGLVFYIYKDYQKDIATKCSPLVSSDNSLRKLDLNSNIVKDLYSKVSTNIREDVADNELDDSMKLYLAYRQIPNNKIYDSNCNLFNNTAMNSYICEENLEFSPKAFKEETLQLEYKKLFGEDQEFVNGNIQLGNSCIGGYQYISERGEYVEGYCKEVATTSYSVNKTLTDAYVQGDTITLKEKVRYYSSEQVPEELKNGVYVYTFKLDNNYNYVYISKTME